MDTSALIAILAAARAQQRLSRADQRFLDGCLPALQDGSLDPEDRAELERIATTLSSVPLPPSSTADHTSQRTDLLAQPSGSTTSTVHISGGTSTGVLAGVILGDVIYHADVTGARRDQLVSYLARLRNEKAVLQVRGLINTPTQGISLPDIYVALAASHSYHVLRPLTADEAVLHQHGQLEIPYDHSAEVCLPTQAIVRYGPDRAGKPAAFRRALVSEELARHLRLIVCGSPGSGKSTLLAHVAWTFAQRGLDANPPPLPGWESSGPPSLLPVIVPLRKLAGMLLRHGVTVATVSTTLRDELLSTYDVRHPDDLLDPALSQGAVLLMFDGLDEVPITATPTSSDRETVLRIVGAFARLYHHVRMVVTCRTRAWTSALAAAAGIDWPQAIVAPFSSGQIRHFVQAWYPHLAHIGIIDRTQAAGYAERLLAAVFDPVHLRLREMAETPLMLTMMAQIQTEGELPRDRPALYDKILQQLLGQWDLQRNGQSLSQVIGDERITSEHIRAELDRLSYRAHGSALSDDGHGNIGVDELRMALTRYFAKVGVAGAYEAAERCVTYFDQRSGVLIPDAEGNTYRFAHLTLQEYCAGRHLLFHESIDQVLALRSDDRWRVPIFLGLGALMREIIGPLRIEQFLRALVDPCERDGTPKAPARWYRDLILVAEVGAERDWGLLRGADIAVARLQHELRAGLVRLLTDGQNAQSAEEALYARPRADAPIPVTVRERGHAAGLLGMLGDPRFPMTTVDWQEATYARGTTVTVAGDHYWRRVAAGSYGIGGWRSGSASATISLPTFWLARYPITVAQYQVFIDADGYQADAWWTSAGRVWRTKSNRIAPALWLEPGYDGANQPVANVTWYEAHAFCSWLDAVIGSPDLQVRLPTNAEWEAAAAYDAQGRRQPYPWGEAAVTPERAIYSAYGGLPSVGLCPLGSTATGALDMGGTVWEWTQTRSQVYPHEDVVNPQQITPQHRLDLRGGSYWHDSAYVSCSARDMMYPDLDFYYGQGFRCVLTPREKASAPPREC